MILVSQVRPLALCLCDDLTGNITARYFNDLWVFDTQEYKWRQIEFKETDNKPSYVHSFINPFQASLSNACHLAQAT